MTEKMTIYEMAKYYYPRLWSIERIKALHKEKLLTDEEYNLIIDNDTNQ